MQCFTGFSHEKPRFLSVRRRGFLRMKINGTLYPGVLQLPQPLAQQARQRYGLSA